MTCRPSSIPGRCWISRSCAADLGIRAEDAPYDLETNVEAGMDDSVAQHPGRDFGRELVGMKPG